MKSKHLSLLFLRRNDEILLAMKKRGFGAGRWNGVGGKIEPNETVDEAMIREAQEEIGVTPTSYKKVGDILFDEYANGEPTQMHVTVYVASQWRDQPTESEEMRPQWYNIDQLPYESMWPDDAYWLPLVIEGKQISATFQLDENDVIVSHTIEVLDS